MNGPAKAALICSVLSGTTVGIVSPAPVAIPAAVAIFLITLPLWMILFHMVR